MIIALWHDNSSTVLWHACKLGREWKCPGAVVDRAQHVGLCCGIPTMGRQVLSGDGLVEIHKLRMF